MGFIKQAAARVNARIGGLDPKLAEAIQQALDKDGLPDAAVEKTWRHNGGLDHARDTHLVMHGKTVTGLTAPFFLPDGSVMLHSHDPAGGVRNNANCRCNTNRNCSA